MTRDEINTLCDLSLQVYGRKYEWQKMIKKGEMVETEHMSARGTPLKIKTIKHLTVNDVLDKMLKLVNDKKEAATKAAEEALKQAKGDESGKEKETNEKAGSSEENQTEETQVSQS